MQTLLRRTHTHNPAAHFAPPEGMDLREAVAYLNRLVRRPAFLTRLRPLLKQESDGWYVAHHFKPSDKSYSLQVFVWPPGTATKVHDHASWGVYAPALGSIHEKRYERLDDGSQWEYAHLRTLWEQEWHEGDGASTVLPYEGGIHSIGNTGEETAISVHLYGPRLSDIDGRDYDPTRDYVCDRLDD